jgi:ribosomal protein S17E
VYEEKIMKMIPEKLTDVVTPEFMDKYPSLYGSVKNIFDSRQGIMALKGAAPVLDVESSPRMFGMTLTRIHELMQRLPAKELERMDVPTVLNKVIQLDKVSNEVAGYANQAEKLISAGKAVPEKLTTYGTKPFTAADKQGFMWREITEPDAATIQSKLLGNSIGGYARPGSYGSLSKGRTAIDNGEVRLFGLYDKNNQLMTNVEYVTNKAETLKNSIPQFYGNGPATGNVVPDKFVPQVEELINKLNPDNIPPSIKQLLRDSGISFTK